MNTNYEWQRQQAQERISSALHEAETHRLARQKAKRPLRGPILLVPVVVLIILALTSLALSGCSGSEIVYAEPVQALSATTGTSGTQSQLAVAEGIAFHDALWKQTQERLSSGDGERPERICIFACCSHPLSGQTRSGLLLYALGQSFHALKVIASPVGEAIALMWIKESPVCIN